MDEMMIVDHAREAFLTALMLCLPVLVVGAAIGIGVGLLQALTQVHDQTLAFVPKLVGILAVLAATLPWLFQELSQYAGRLFSEVPF